MSSQLRAVGLNGFGGEEGIMSYALNVHFQCKGPSGWHFVAKRVKRNKDVATAALRNEIRLLSKPKWFPLYLNDIIFTGELNVCKFLPRPEMAFLPSVCQNSSRWQEDGQAAEGSRGCRRAI